MKNVEAQAAWLIPLGANGIHLDMTVIELAHFKRTVRRASRDLVGRAGSFSLHLSASDVRDPAVPSAYVRVWHSQWHVTLKLEQADMRQPRLAYQCRLTSPLALSCWSCGLNGRQLGAK